MSRDEVFERLRENNIFARKYFYPLTADQACFKNKYRGANIINAREMAQHILILPMYAELGIKVAGRIIKIIKQGVN